MRNDKTIELETFNFLDSTIECALASTYYFHEFKSTLLTYRKWVRMLDLYLKQIDIVNAFESKDLVKTARYKRQSEYAARSHFKLSIASQFADDISEAYINKHASRALFADKSDFNEIKRALLYANRDEIFCIKAVDVYVESAGYFYILDGLDLTAEYAQAALNELLRLVRTA